MSRGTSGRDVRARAILAGALLGLAACGGTERVPGNVVVGEPAPSYTAVTLQSDSASLADLRGKVVLLNIWATWCAPCREEIPALQTLYTRYAPQGLELVGVSVDAEGEEANVKRFAQSFGVTYSIWLDPQERVTSTFRAIGVPSTYLIGRDGTLLWKHMGPVRADDPALGKLLRDELAKS